MLPKNFWAHWYDSMKFTFSEPKIQTIFIKAKDSYSKGFREFVEKQFLPKKKISSRWALLKQFFSLKIGASTKKKNKKKK
jgi:hypothetical protein